MNERQMSVPGRGNKLLRFEKHRYAEYAVRFVLAFLLARVNILHTVSPFGAAFAAACPPGIKAWIAVIGAAAGYLSYGNLNFCAKYIAIAVLAEAVLTIMRGTEVSEHKVFAPAIAGISAACVGFVYAFSNGFAVIPLVFFVTEVVLTFTCVFFYDIALSPWNDSDAASRTRHDAGAVILLSTVLMSFMDITLFGVMSIGRAAAVLAVMLASFKGGISRGCTCGVLIGVAVDLSCGTVPFFTMAYGFSALISGIFSKNGRLIFLLSFIMSDALAVVWCWTLFRQIPALYETFAASVVFLLLPDRILAKVSAYFPTERNSFGAARAREYSRERIRFISGAFLELYYSVHDSEGRGGTDENTAQIFDRAADAVCRTCSRSARCWQINYNDTFDVMNNVTPALLKNREVVAEDFPLYFSEKCDNFPELLSAINGEARSFLYRRQFKKRLLENRGTAYNLYADISAILKNLSDELGDDIVIESSLERRLHKYLRGLDIEASAAVFRLRGGRLRAEIKSSELYLLRRDKNYLEKLSETVGVRLCTPAERNSSSRLVLLEAEPLSVKIGSSSFKKRGQSVSGDKYACFRTDEGILHILLSDGMGTGQEAAKISENAVNILGRFLSAGVSPELSLGIFDDLMRLKNTDETESAAIDLLSLNMFTGRAEIFKYGAAPSYLKTSSSVKRISSDSFPSGLSAGYTEARSCAALSLSPGSFAVLISDGIITGRDDKWLCALIEGYEGDDPEELSQIILNTAMEKGDAEDDMTTLVVRLEKRG